MLLGCFDECFKKFGFVGTGFDEPLGMPLHAYQKARGVGGFGCFHDAIGTHCHDAEAFPEILDGLVVVRVHLEAGGLEIAAES